MSGFILLTFYFQIREVRQKLMAQSNLTPVTPGTGPTQGPSSAGPQEPLRVSSSS